MNPITKVSLENNNHTKVTAKQMLEVDKVAIEEFGINLIQMMELAGYHLAILCTKYLKEDDRVLILAGSGHNGGGGLVAAKHLYNLGFQVSVYLTSSDLKQTTKHQLNILKKLDLTIFTDPSNLLEFDLLVDAILGYNVKSKVKEPAESIIGMINQSKITTISLDLPSGLNPDTGKPEGVAVRANATLTLAAPKVGLLKPVSKQYVGDLYLADIGIPKEVFGKI